MLMSEKGEEGRYAVPQSAAGRLLRLQTWWRILRIRVVSPVLGAVSRRLAWHAALRTTVELGVNHLPDGFEKL